jgi:NADPH:quinone reductase-like Zn-dependent oxidoreductase
MAKRCLGVAHVVGVCSSRNADFARECGADDVYAYDRESLEDYLTRHPRWAGRFDLIFDTIGDDQYWRIAAPRLLSPTGRFTTAAPPPSRPGLAGEDVGPLAGLALMARMAWRQATHPYRLITALFSRLPVSEAMPRIADWLGQGLLTPHRAAAFPLERIARAHALSETGRVVGKISIVMD